MLILDQKPINFQNNNLPGTQSLKSIKLEDTVKLLQPKFLENSSESLIFFELNKILS